MVSVMYHDDDSDDDDHDDDDHDDDDHDHDRDRCIALGWSLPWLGSSGFEY